MDASPDLTSPHQFRHRRHGDLRAYGESVAVRAVHSHDGMSAAYSRIPHEVLDKISIRITNTLKNSVNRVAYDISNKPPATVEWE